MAERATLTPEEVEPFCSLISHRVQDMITAQGSHTKYWFVHENLLYTVNISKLKPVFHVWAPLTHGSPCEKWKVRCMKYVTKSWSAHSHFRTVRRESPVWHARTAFQSHAWCWGVGGCRAVCTDQSDYSQFHLPQLYYIHIEGDEGTPHTKYTLWYGMLCKMHYSPSKHTITYLWYDTQPKPLWAALVCCQR